MKLRNRAITAEQHSSKQPKQPATIADVDHTEGLPEELLQLMGNYLIPEDVAAASMVCRHWAQVFRAGEDKRRPGQAVAQQPGGQQPSAIYAVLLTHSPIKVMMQHMRRPGFERLSLLAAG